MSDEDEAPKTIEVPDEPGFESDDPVVEAAQANEQESDDAADSLSHLSDEELGRRVRRTASFRAAVACEKFAEEATELRDGDGLAWDRLVDETHAEQGTGVTARGTTAGIVNSFIDVVNEHAQLAEHPTDAAERAASEAIDE